MRLKVRGYLYQNLQYGLWLKIKMLLVKCGANLKFTCALGASLVFMQWFAPILKLVGRERWKRCKNL